MYAGPFSEATLLERCQCTEAGYNLYSACTACQFGTTDTQWLSRSDWFAGCGTVRLSGQVQAYPPSTRGGELDEWIVHPYDPKFSVAAALNVANNVLVVSIDPSTSRTSTSLSSNPSTFSTYVITNTASTVITATVLQTNGIGTVLGLPPGASATVVGAVRIRPGQVQRSSFPSATPLPAIIGGTVGGVVVVLMLATVIWIWRSQRSAQRTTHPEQLANEPSGVCDYLGVTSAGVYHSDNATNTSGMAADQMTTSPWTIPPTTLGVNYSQNGLTSGPSSADPSSSGVGGQRGDQIWPAKATYVSPKAWTPAPPPYSDGA
ncbi:hypothetical protein M408DRAFT_20452 [Serendipita vermifera MAFF 305830]|uniref:Transmembrane protein n=1 Tax=Serendipita vermifera MAFF 305830 TaxID=933852 RepID=A0A0C3BJ64_SERVB|nr:hypothetical protein M408DRAFT_20452 [Serendipita vermifera MAFF 305830]